LLNRLHLATLILIIYLAGCATVAPPTPPPVPTPRPRFINFETGGRVKSMAFDGNHLWLGLPSGIIRYDTRTPDQYEIFTIRSTDGLLARGIFKVAIDPQGVKWIGTYGGGLSRYDGREWLTYTPYGGGKISYDHRWTTYPRGKGLGDLWVYDILFESDGAMWIATWKGASYFNGKSFKTYTQKDGLLDKWVYAIAKDQDGILWFGTEGGVNRFDGQNWTGYTHLDGLGGDIGSPQTLGDSYDDNEPRHHGGEHKNNRQANPNYVLDIVVDHQNVKWIGTWGAGLSRFDGKHWTTFTAGHGTIGGNFVHALEVDREGTLWAATDKGVSRFDGKTWLTYTTADGLLDNNVFSIAFDREGNKWFGTWTGLSKMID